MVYLCRLLGQGGAALRNTVCLYIVFAFLRLSL